MDRIHPELGCVLLDVRWVSHRSNSLRSDMTLAEAELLIAGFRAIALPLAAE